MSTKERQQREDLIARRELIGIEQFKSFPISSTFSLQPEKNRLKTDKYSLRR